GGAATSNGSAIAMRRNKLVNCVSPPIDDSQTAYYGKFMDTTVTDKPTIGAGSTVSVLTGTCSVSKPAYPRRFIDLYVSDPEGDAASDPQGLTYLATYEDNGSA